MKTHSQANYLVCAALVFVGLPVFFWATGDFPRRTLLKESLSILTLGSFALLIGQFFLARINGYAVNALGPRGVVRFHKVIGYTFVSVMLFHPLFVVLPRYFESGVDPLDAFTVLITEFDSPGVLVGMTAWCLLVILGVTSLLRGNLTLACESWRILHGVLSVLFVLLATWHAVDLGRHTGVVLSSYLIILTAGAVALLLKSYAAGPHKKEQTHD